MMRIKSVSYKELLFRWVVGLFMFLNLFALSGAASRLSSVKTSPYRTEQGIVKQNTSNSHKIFYKSFVDKLNWIYSRIPLLKYAFKNLLILKNHTVHIEWNVNSLLVLFINFLISTLSAAIFLFYRTSPKTSLQA